MPENYQQDIRLMKFPNYYYYTFKDILDHLYGADYVTDYYSRSIYANLPIPFASDRYLPVPLIMALANSKDPIRHQNQLISMTSLSLFNDKSITPGDFDRQVRLQYFALLSQKMHDSLLLIPDIEASLIPHISESTRWLDIVNAVNHAYLVKNGWIKTHIKSFIKRNRH